MLAVANKFQDQPIAFVAVNSGNDRKAVQSYVRKHKITIPMLVDVDRSFESSLGQNEISLSNIWQVKIMKPDGQIERASVDDMEGAAKAALVGAEWHVSPKGTPKELQDAWRNIEFGNYKAGAKDVGEGLKSNKEQVASAAKRLNDYVQSAITERVVAADEAIAEGDKFTGFERYTAIEENFKGYVFPDGFDDKLASIKEDPVVKDEISALKRYKTAERAFYSRSPLGKKKARQILKVLIEKSPDTRGGREAAKALEQIGAK